jgi:uncharacterized protein (DUF305 family)
MRGMLDERPKGPMDTMKRQRPMLVAVLLGALAALAVALSACGDDDDGTASSGNESDRAFLEAMIPHHESAVEMARLAKRHAEHAQVMELADSIISTQRMEIRRMERIHRRLFDEKVIPNPDAHQALGLSAEEAGMAHMESTPELERANPFDRAFIDEMAGHHQGAVRMARAVLDQTDDDEVRSLADAIVAAQSKEIDEMSDWRKAWYGTAAPAEGMGEKAEPGRDSMGEHEGH